MIEDSIIKKIAALYLKYGIKNVRIDDVAFMLGISKKTLYSIIENREALIENVVEYNLKTFYSKIISEKLDDNILMNLCKIYYAIIREVKKINSSYVHDLKKYHNKLYHKIICFRDEDIYLLTETWFQKGIQDGIFRNDIVLPLVFQNQIHKVSTLLYNTTVEYPKPLSASAAYGLILNDIRGITTLKGHEIFDRDFEIMVQLYK